MKLSLLLLVLAVFCLSSFSLCEDTSEKEEQAQKKEKLDLPKSGSLASLVKNRDDGVQIPETWQPKAKKGEEKKSAPLSASINETEPGKYSLTVTNADAADTYYAFISAVFQNSKGSPIKTERISVTLKPGESTSKIILASGDIGLVDVRVDQWKNLTEKKREKEEAKKEEQQKKKQENNQPAAGAMIPLDPMNQDSSMNQGPP